MENNDIEIRGKVWYFSSGEMEIEAWVKRGKDNANFRVKYAKADDHIPSPDSVNYFRAELTSFAGQFTALGFRVTIDPELYISDMRK